MRFSAVIVPALWCTQLLGPASALADNSSDFHFQTIIGKWHVDATAHDLTLTWMPSQMVWRSKILMTGRARHMKEPCAGNVVSYPQKASEAQQIQINDGVVHAKSVKLSGVVQSPDDLSITTPWSLELIPRVVHDVMDFNFMAGGCMGSNSETRQFKAWCKGDATVCHPYFSTDVKLVWELDDTEALVGAGEQFSAFNMRGDKFDLWIREHGLGRGRQPISGVVNKVCKDLSGNKHSTYSQVPAFLSTRGYGVLLRNSQLVTADFRKQAPSGEVRHPTASLEVSFEDSATCSFGDAESQVAVVGHLIAGEHGVRSLLHPLTSLTGRMQPPPSWTQKGLILGHEGGHEEVSERLASVRAAGVPVAAVWIQDWSGLVDKKVAHMVWWNWKLDEERYPKSWMRNLRSEGVRVMTYVNPFLTTDFNDEKRPELYEEAKRLGYLVSDTLGNPVLRKQFAFGPRMAQVNLPDPKAMAWWKNMLKCNVMLACEGPDGQDSEPLVHGWMHDYGEYFPMNAWVSDEALATGPASEVHNLYPKLSQTAARDVVAEHPDVMPFVRSGSFESPGLAKMFWLGDQMTTLDGCGGLQSALMAAMSGSVSGWALTHMDIGGIVQIPYPIPGVHFHRTAELLVRAFELAIFVSAVLRSHPGLKPGSNAQVWDREVLPHTTVLTKLFVALAPYRAALFHEAQTTGLPPVRHGLLVYPDEGAGWFNRTDGGRGASWHCREGHEVGLQQFFLGDDLLIAPVVDNHAEPSSDHASGFKLHVFFPPGSWTHFWTGATVVGPQTSLWHAPLGQPAVFYREDSDDWAPFFRELVAEFAPSKLSTEIFV